MKRIATKSISLFAAAALLVVMTGVASAASTASSTTSSKDLGKFNAAITMLNSYKSLPQGDQIIAKQLSDNFKVSSDKVSALLSRNNQYGDVAATLAFADKLSGGASDANINKVMSMKSTAGGWDQVAKSLNVKISDVNSKLDSFEDTAHKSIKQALAESLGTGSAAGGMGSGPHDMESVPGEGTGGTSPDTGLGGMSDSESESGAATGGTGTLGGTGGTDSGTMGGDSSGGTGGSMDPHGGSSSSPGSGY